MKYNELCAISGLSGLFQLVSTKSDGAIVKSLEENMTKFVAARSHTVTPLDSIEVYTKGENVRLMEVFQSFKANEALLEDYDIIKADSKSIKAKFAQLYPDHDEQRVYVSDMKKMMKWYGILKKLDLLNEEPVAEEEIQDEVAK